MKNKVLYGIEKLHFGEYEEKDDGTVVLGTPFHQPGAIGFSPEQSTEESQLYADNGEYWSEITDGPTNGSVKVALFEDEFKKRFLGYKRLNNGGLAKVNNAQKKKVYMAFELKGDAERRRVIYYNGTLGAINREYNTTENAVNPGIDSLDISFTGDKKTGVPKAVLKPGDSGYESLFTNPTAPEFEEESE